MFGQVQEFEGSVCALIAFHGMKERMDRKKEGGNWSYFDACMRDGVLCIKYTEG